ncbi:hypothetical protein BDQ12DRAFT_688549 [Crucibulum laeve]|uniref:Uncharacterized protein n=1 Tax=Crucibulum laeve TaxID=68775 RepID=A0A5C3LT49_9AGAR|nr:hypothetical protein BDQ12DRAFT_688549 [Crucibulum laeve]
MYPACRYSMCSELICHQEWWMSNCTSCRILLLVFPSLPSSPSFFFPDNFNSISPYLASLSSPNALYISSDAMAVYALEARNENVL